MRKSRVALVAGLAAGAAALTILASAKPSAEATPAGRCQPPQQLAIVSPNGDVEAATPASHVPGGWRVVCWPPRFYTGTVIKGRSSTRSENGMTPWPGSPPDIDTLRSTDRAVLTYNVLFELAGAGIDPTGGNARYKLADGFVSAMIDGDEEQSHTSSSGTTTTTTTTKCSWISRGSAPLRGDLLLAGQASYQASGIMNSPVKVVRSCETRSSDQDSESDSTESYSDVFDLKGAFHRLSFYGSITGSTSKAIKPPPPVPVEGGATYDVSFKGSEWLRWDLTGFLESAQLSRAGRPPARLSYLLVGKVDPDGKLSLKSKGKQIGRLNVGRATVVVFDESAEHNLHLKGPGVNKATGLAQIGMVTWTVDLKKGTYTLFCDGHPDTEKVSFRVS